MKILSLDALELAADGVERGADELPRSWPLFRTGDNFLTVDGRAANLQLDESDLASIVSYHRSKGVKIPIDSAHVVSNLAGRLNLDEAEVLRRMPRLSGVAGFGDLELRDGALHLCDVEWNEIGAEVMRAGMIRYYSPTIRGLDGKSPLRITSVALTNSPRLNNIPSLAASDDDDETENPPTPELVREAIGQLTKLEVPMPDDPTKTAATPPAAPPEAGKKSDLLDLLKEILGDDVTADNAKAKLAALKTRADAQGELSERVKELECAEETRKLAEARTRGLADGKLTPALLEKSFFSSMKSAELAEYLESVPPGCAAPVGVLELGEARSVKPAAPAHFASVTEAVAAAKTTEMKGF